ncbi:MAG: ligase-associated DNA damage response endonuclease PdeM [Caldilineaceae bacterium]|nr:ligase-associated DNA damage response endonuclease PdeM [Caldilineaceae bacterium]
MATLILSGEEIQLLPEKALYWPARRTLVIADPHLGKAAAFRAHGVPVPGGTTTGNLARLNAILTRTGAERLICLGDLLHARDGRAPQTVAAVTAWRAQFSALEFVLVRGNHDAQAGDPPAEWRVTCVDEPWADPPFAWRHYPETDPAAYALAGHLHPAVRLAGPGGLKATLPCFYFSTTCGVLPAFGDFTGTSLVRPQPGERVFVVIREEVIEKS